MGNKLGRRRQVVDDKYTRPQGLYPIKDVDYKKLRKLILESKLAPCYPGGDECDCALFEECPICFLYYPTLNRSRCCMKSICTECFLQMKNPNSTRPTQCPFCKTSNYAVEYKGVKSKEERGQEQIEEQKVIEAKIRMRQQELQEEEEKQNKKEEVSSSSSEFQTGNTCCSSSAVMESEEVTASPGDVTTTHRQFQSTRQNRGDEFDLDLEDIMVMEAIWLSIQENGRAGYTSTCDGLPEQYETRDHYVSSGPVTIAEASPSPSPSSPSGGLACAIAALAERQQLNGESSTNNYSSHMSPFDMLPSSSRNSQRLKKPSQHPPENYSSSMAMSNARMFAGDCGVVNHVSEVAEAGTSYISSDDSDGEAAAVLPPPPPLPQYFRRNSKRTKNIQRKYSSSKSLHDTMADEEWEFDALPPPPPPPPPPFPYYNSAGTSGVHSDHGEGGSYYHAPPPPLPQYGGTDNGFHSSVANPIVPESFEEQMMLAMAVSLADARARTTAQGVAWQ